SAWSRLMSQASGARRGRRAPGCSPSSPFRTETTLTTEAAESEPPRYGLVIEWPRPAENHGFVHPCLVSVFEADAHGTERQFSGVPRMTLPLAPAEAVTADVETILGEDGEPLRIEGKPAVDGGELATAVLRYMVAAVRVRDAAG